MDYTFTVVGEPGAQGSKRSLGNGIMIEMSKKVKPWRNDVKYAFMMAYPDAQRAESQPVEITITFLMKRPKKPKAPYPIGRTGDIDKLARSTLDALTEMGAIYDDSNVVDCILKKRYATGHTGAMISIRSVVE